MSELETAYSHFIVSNKVTLKRDNQNNYLTLSNVPDCQIYELVQFADKWGLDIDINKTCIKKNTIKGVDSGNF